MKVDFSYAEGKSPNNYRKFSKIPCMSIYGANASGKTNIIKALFIYILNQ